MVNISRVRFDTKALYRAIDKKRVSGGMSWQQVAREVASPSGTVANKRTGSHPISASTIRNTELGTAVEADGILAMVKWLGMTFQDFTVGVSNPSPSKPLKKELMYRFDAKVFYKALDKERRLRGLTWAELASEFPLYNPGMLTRLKKGGRMGADMVVVLSAWLGRSSESFTHITKY